MYTNFKDLHKAYGFDNPSKSRENLSYEEEQSFVEDCFNTYEYIGFTERFKSPYEDCKQYNEKKFIVLGRADETTTDLEYLPMWKIRFEDETETFAYPEEICLAEHR